MQQWIPWIVALALTGASGAVRAQDIWVEEIEVTQGIQTMPTHSVTLIAYRGTAVRVSVGATGLNRGTEVTGVLHVLVNGTPVTPPKGLAPIGPLENPPAVIDRQRDDHTLNFELLAPTPIPPSSDVDFLVDLDPVKGEKDISNNSGSRDDLTFHYRQAPVIRGVLVDYPPAGLGLAPANRTAAGVADAYARGIFPMPDGNSSFYQQSWIPWVLFDEDCNGNKKIDVDGVTCLPPESDLLFMDLEDTRQLFVNAGVGAANHTFVFGWLPPGACDPRGVAQQDGRVAYSSTHVRMWQRTFAHELLHCLGLDHTMDLTGEVGWDVGARLVDNPIGNDLVDRVKRSDLFDTMVTCKNTVQAWIPPATYEYLACHSVFAPVKGIDWPPLASNVMVVKGSMSDDGTILTHLDPVFQYPWQSQPTAPGATATYRLIVRNTGGSEVSVPFDARRASCSDGPATFGSFAVMVPVGDLPGKIDSLEILNANGASIGRRSRSASPPLIQINSPQQGEKIRDTLVVAFDIVDPDGDETLAHVAWSPDGGQTIVPVRVRTTERKIVVDTALLPRDCRPPSSGLQTRPSERNSGRGVVYVFVSDGLRTTVASVGGIGLPD